MDDAAIEKGAYDLIGLLMEVPSPFNSTPPPPNRVGEGPVHDIGEIDNLRLEQKDHFGEMVARFHVLGYTMVGLYPPQYKLLREYVEQIFVMPEFNEKSTRDFLEEHTFDWLVIIYQTKKAEKSLLNHLRDLVSDQDKTYTFYFRLRPLILEKGFTIGSADITFLTKAFLDAEEEKFIKAGKTKVQFDDFMQQFTDYALVKVSASGVEDRSMAEAKKKAELSVSVLKCFLQSFSVHGQFKMPDVDHNATQKNAAPYMYHYASELSTFTVGLLREGDLAPIEMTAATLLDFEKNGIRSFSECILTPKDNEFYYATISAIKNFGDLVSESNKYTRIVKLISFFEAILIDRNKRIGGGETLLAKGLIPRLPLETSDQTLAAELSHHFYRIRDAYVHHGQENLVYPEKLGQFQTVAFIFLRYLVDLSFTCESFYEFYQLLKTENQK